MSTLGPAILLRHSLSSPVHKYLCHSRWCLAGADRALREMLSIFRDDPIEGPLQEASMGVWTKILQEES